ncbi:MAG TPA: BTAD domain-containing putative transcriptional regulator [Gaiellaceae bacterium]|nr:BTAD domain-containing putative transcriptional regulator [Gaiellaceae bacterium]
MPLEFRTLGELEVFDGEKAVPIQGAIQRSVLALLLMRPNAVVRTEDVVDEVWGLPAPETAAKMVQNAVSKLRKSGFAAVLATRAGGYMLRVDPDEIDAKRFERLLERAREALAAGDPQAAEELLAQAEALWRGPPFADVATERFAQLEIARLEELRLEAAECAVEVGLALGRHRELAAKLENLVAQHPFRETLRLQLMLSLYRSGRQAEALAAYQAARAALRDELGLEPSPSLQRLEQAILLQDPALDVEFLSPSVSAAHALRKTLTVVHAELAREGRALDPEALLALTTRVEETLRAAVVAHGGTVSSSTGISFVAVFGLPTLAEDDTLRAARAALEARAAIAALDEAFEREWGVRCTLRIGVATGTVLVESPGVETGAATGEVFAIAARLARVAGADEVLLAPSTYGTLRNAVEVEPTTGDEAETAWRLRAVRLDAAMTPRLLDSPLVGRDWELAQLQHAFERVTQGRTSYLFTLLGPGGIGKSRLARAFVESVSGAATVLTGRCPSYGAGVTLWPLAEIVREAAGATTQSAIAGLVAEEPEGEEIAARIAGAIGADDSAGSAAELFWAVRSLLAAQARKHPLIVVFDDLQWAEPTLLDLLEHLVEATRDAPMLLLCLARSELLESRPTWSGGKLNASTVQLEPLSQPDRELLIAQAGGRSLDAAVAAQVAEAAEGNPLFLEQMVALAIEEGTDAGEVLVPPTIQALLAARVDRLVPLERNVLERAAVVGKEFTLAEVTALSPEPERDDVLRQLESLARRDLLGVAAATRRVDAGFFFRHGLIRDAAYDALPKVERAALHEALARFIERVPDQHAGRHEEVLAFHLEQAYRYRSELGQSGLDVERLAEQATTLLAAAGRRAYARDDVPAAVALLERAADLAGPGTRTRYELLPDLGEAVRESGDYPRAEAALAEAIEGADDGGDEALAEYARLVRLRMRVQTDPDLGAEEVIAGARRALDAFEPIDDAQSQAKAWELLAWGHWVQCQAEATEEALAQSLEHARRAADPRTAAQSRHLMLGAAVFGPRPVPDAIARCEEILADGRQQKRVTASALRALAALKAMAGEFDEARFLLRRFSAIVEDLGLRVTAASAAETYAEVELLAGDPVSAERRLRAGYAELEEMGESSTSANLAALLAEALQAQGRHEEAVAVSDVKAAEDDVSAHVHLSGARARALASVGRIDEADLLARSAVARARTTDFLVMSGDALCDLAAVRLLADGVAEARHLLEEALQAYRQKQHLVAIAQTENLRSALVSGA